MRCRRFAHMHVNHIRVQSILVKEGEYVKRSQEVGKLGSSGNSTMPHLHVNLFHQMDDLYSAKVLPFVFCDYMTLSLDGQWVENKLSIPRVETVVRFHA